MDSLFGVALTDILIALIIMVGAIFGVLGYIAWRNPLLVRMGIRNIARRKAQTVLIIIGLMLSTLIISAAFATGDTVGYSVSNTVYNDFGEADVVLAFDRDEAELGRDGLLQSDVDFLRDAHFADADIDGITGIIQTPLPAINVDARLSEPNAQFVGVDPATTDDFRQLITPEGDRLLATDLGPDDAYVSARLARDLRVELGDTIRLFFGGQPYDFTVTGVVQDNALTASTALSGTQLAGGVVAPISRVREIIGEPERVDLIIVSATGGVRDTLDLIDGIVNKLEDTILANQLPVQEIINKATAVGFAELAGSLFVTFFLVFGLFSMAAGVMLIFLTFVMLAAERRSEMGMARAVGMKRLHLTESFIAEGMAYNLGSALVGAVLGLGVAYGLITALGNVFEDFGLGITFNVNPVGFFISYFLGVVITFATVAFSSWRAANLNIVRAIRDIPEPEPLRGQNTSIGGLLKASVGAAWYVVWIVLIALAAILVFQAFIFSLAMYGLPLVGVGLLIGAYIWGLRALQQPRKLLQIIGLVLWAVAFNVVALIGWFLLKTKRWADRHRNSGGWALLMLVIGILATWWGGWISSQAFAYTAGTTLIILAVAMLAVYFGAPSRPTFTIASGATIWFWLLPLPFSLLFEDGKGWIDPLDGLAGLVGLGHGTVEGNIEMFFVSGVCITAASTLFVIFNADRLLGSIGLLQRFFGGLTPAIRTAIAYPLAAKFRTGMTLAMFTLVMFSLVVMSTLNYNFTQLFLGDGARGGFDIQVTANPNNPIGDLEAALTEAGYDVQSNVSSISTMVSGSAQLSLPQEADTSRYFYQLAGLDSAFIDNSDFGISTSAIGYDSTEAVMEALRTDPTVMVANETIMSFTQQQNFDNREQLTIQGRIQDFQREPWEPVPVLVTHPETGEVTEMKIIGFVDSPIISGIVPQWFAMFVNYEVARDLFPRDFTEVFFLQANVSGGEAIRNVAADIESTLLERGVRSRSLQQLVDDSAAQSNAFSTLFEAFMSLGLIVGIAALGVIAFRTVAERRQQIGMLRAIGYSRRLVAVSFFLESSFIAVTGVAMGLILGGALSYNLLTSPEFTNGAEIDFAIPWARILIIVGVAYAASALMTLVPARSASRVEVAEALRYSA